MSQKSLNDLLRAEDKAGWIEKKREGLGCGIKELEASWNRNVERYKMTLPSKKTQQKTLLERATKYSKGIRYRDSSAYNKQSNKKSPLRNVSYQSTNALTPKEQTRLALESMRESESESEFENKISSKKSKGSGKRKTRKKRGRGNEPTISSREWVVENTQASINRFVNSNLPERGDGFNTMIRRMTSDEMDGGFWIIEWSLTRPRDDNLNHFHLAHDDEDNEGPDLIRFVDGPDAPAGRRKRRKIKTKRKKRKKKKTKRKKRKKRKKKTRRRRR